MDSDGLESLRRSRLIATYTLPNANRTKLRICAEIRDILSITRVARPDAAPLALTGAGALITVVAQGITDEIGEIALFQT